MRNDSFFKKIGYILLFPFLLVEKGLIYFYKYCISPFLPHMCKYTPSCSSYFLTAIKEYGAVKGFFIGTKRILRCNPFSKGGYDPVKYNMKGKIKWIL